MSARYFALLTNIGVAKIANAAALGIKLNITELAVGDGGGTLPTPTPDQTALVNERRRAPINQLSIDPLNDAQIIVEQVIPENVGGWWIKEVGLYDEDGDLVAVSNCPETYKPLLQEGSGRTQIVRMVIIVSNTSSVTVKIDPAVVLATREYVDNAVDLANKKHKGELKASDGAIGVGYRYKDVYSALSRTKTLSDYNVNISHLGYHPEMDSKTFYERLIDNDLLLPGGLAIAKETYGIRRNAAALSIRINHGNEGFNTQVTGVSDSVTLRAYGSVDDVGVFIEGYSEAYKPGEDVTAVTSYTENSVTGNFDFSLIKVGMVLATKHFPSCWGLVNNVDSAKKTIYVDKWSSDGVTAITPPGSAGLYINYKSKVFGANCNAVINPDSKAEHASSVEFGMVNNKFVSPSDFNGVDSVSLGSMRGTAAFYARNTKLGNNWQNGFRSAGAEVAGFYATLGTEGTITPRAFVNAGCTQGYLSYGKDVLYHSVVRPSGITGEVTHSIDGQGLAIEFHYKTNTINAGETTTSGTYLWIYASLNTGTINLSAGVFEGKTIRLRKPYAGGDLTVSGNGKNILGPEGINASVTLTTARDYEFTYVVKLGYWVMG